MYGHEAALASTGVGLMLFGGYVDVLQATSIVIGLVLLGLAILIAFRRTRRNH